MNALKITKERIKAKLHQLMDDESFDENRFEQELIYYVEKFDINEEKNKTQRSLHLFFVIH